MCFNGLPGGAADEELQAREACLEPDGAVYAADEELQADAVGGRGGCGGRAGGGGAAAARRRRRTATLCCRVLSRGQVSLIPRLGYEGSSLGGRFPGIQF